MVQVEHVLAVQNKLGEGPRWHVEEQALYWVDIEQDRIYRWEPTAGEPEVFDIGYSVGALAFRRDGGLLLATSNGFAHWDRSDQSLHFIGNPEPDNTNSRLNDGVVDRNGRFWAGTIAPNFGGALYRLDPDGSIHTMVRDVGVSNGIGWSPDNQTMYYVDSDHAAIFAFDYEPDRGTITNQRDFVRLPEGGAVPDGLVVDVEGYIWCAHWGGWNITRYAPDGTVDQMIEFPAEQITACTFGGPNLDELYVTSAWTGIDDERRGAQPLAGDLFRIRPNVRGTPEPHFAG
jgi:sugar lactone lactonase YvrE